jgi:DNA-binding transcriptional MerR regulator/effector-binding domain-containing protein
MRSPGPGPKFTIGQFSRASGLTVKTLRFYHEQGLLVPSFIDPQTDYRYYDPAQLETARTIAFLRGLEFPLGEIKSLLHSTGEDERLLDAVERQKAALAARVAQLRKAVRSLDQFIQQERQAAAMAQSAIGVQEKVLGPMLVAGVRMKGRYSECGRGFATIGRSLGRYVCGTPFLLHYDDEYREDDADFEACMPVRQAKAVDGVSVRELPGGRCVALLHKGPYDQLGRSYAVILKHVQDKGYRVLMPTREVYLKGPGMIFKGNPRNYLTEIQMLVEEEAGQRAASK